MGSTSMFLPEGVKPIPFLLQEAVGDAGRWSVVAHGMAPGTTDFARDGWTAEKTLWVAIKGYDGNVWALAILHAMKYHRETSAAYSGREIWWKFVSESMGPGQYGCPRKVFDALTPLVGDANEYAAEWRAQQLLELAKQEAKPKITVGDHIHFATALEFKSGASLQNFEYLGGNLFRGIDAYGHYKIPGWKQLEFTKEA